MLDQLIERQIAAQERRLGAPLEYLRHIARVSRAAFFKFALFMPVATHRRVLPPDAYFVAHILASRAEDCGTCVQIEVNEARRHGVSPSILRAVLADLTDDLPADLAEVLCFTQAVVERTDEEDETRERLRARYGEEGLVELALGIAAARVFPVTQRALGHAKSCALVEIEVEANAESL